MEGKVPRLENLPRPGQPIVWRSSTAKPVRKQFQTETNFS